MLESDEQRRMNELDTRESGRVTGKQEYTVSWWQKHEQNKKQLWMSKGVEDTEGRNNSYASTTK